MVGRRPSERLRCAGGDGLVGGLAEPAAAGELDVEGGDGALGVALGGSVDAMKESPPPGGYVDPRAVAGAADGIRLFTYVLH